MASALTELLSLKGQVALVTGSTRGIGWHTAQLLAEHGATVVVNGRRDRAAVEARVAELMAVYGQPASGVVGDAGDPVQVRAVYQHVFAEHGRLDILVNNAGVLADAFLGMIGDELVEETFRINTFGALHHLQAAARLMQRQRRGSIVNLTSIIGVNGNNGQVVYASTKAALVGLTRAAAKELAPKQIRVNAIAPGFIDTDMTRALPVEIFQRRESSIAMGRVGQADDIARAVLFFACDLSSYVTGQVLGVDGGMLI
jgi:3-oxoacyl-[acyl-carrier protein] reductase